MLVIVLFLPLSCARGIFVSEDVDIKALETQGYSNIEIVDNVWFAMFPRGGEGSDAARFTAIATNPIGKQVAIYVFSDLFFKGATIRTK